MPSTSTALDLLADDLTFEVASDDLDLGQLRHRPTPIRSPRSAEALLASPCSRSHAITRRGLLGRLLRAPLAGAVLLAAEEHGGEEPLRVVGALVAHLVAGQLVEPLGRELLEPRSCSRRRRARSACSRMRPSSTASTSRLAAFEPAVEVDRGDHRLHRVGEDRRLRPAARRVLALAEPQRGAEVDLAGELGQHLRAHHRRRAASPARPRAAAGTRGTRSR